MPESSEAFTRWTSADWYFSLHVIMTLLFQELLAISPTRMIKMDLNSGDTLQTWQFPNIETWSVNWEIKQVQVKVERETVAFQCLTADCKVVHEFIGGYMFLAMRSGDKSQTLNQEMFHKLTGGRD